jgi:hypothetical protein
MTAPDPRAQSVSDLFRRLKGEWPPGAKWEWDGRMNCALSTLGGSDEAQGRQALIGALPVIWTAEKLADAPEVLRKICGATGGLRGGQLVFSAELLDATVAYCLWWPWGSGSNFSARLGAATADGTSLSPAVRTGFGLG